MSEALSKIELLLRDRSGELYEVEAELDRLDLEIHLERSVALNRTREGLRRLGIKAELKPLRRLPSEERTSRHVQAGDDVEQLVIQAQRAAARRSRKGIVTRRGTGRVIGIR